MENRPLVSIIMPTYNSGKTVRMSLESIKNQNFDQNLIEILVVDGGSVDNTIDIAKEFNCRIIQNSKVNPEFAKYEGIKNAYGKYAVFLDSDEVLENKESFKKKIDLLIQNQNVKNIITGGLKNPDGYPNINYYINAIGDPFSFFMYNIFSENFYKSIGERYKNVIRNENNVVITLGDNEITPICDGGGHFFDLEFLKNNFDTSDVNIVPKIFYEMVGKTKNFAVFNNDFVVHYSTTSIKKYFKKIRWRIVNNIFYKNETAGFANRGEVNKVFNIKKYLFIPYSLLLAPAIIHSVLLFLKHKNSILLMHFIFSFYTGILICYYYFLKILKIKPKLSLYGR